MRHTLLLLAAFLLLPLVTAHADDHKKKDTRPNILFLFTDDHACHAISAYNGLYKDVAPTPNIDRIAKGGILFKNSYCANSICGPSRACILTGKHSHKNGFMRNGNKFNPDQTTFPPLMQKAGYETAVIGKWHLGTNPAGFDKWIVLPGQGDYYNPKFIVPNDKPKPPTKRIQIEGHCTDVVTDLALDWLKDERDADKPFILMCQHKAPHRTWMPAERHLTLFDDIEMPEPKTLFDLYEDNASPARFNEMEIDRHMSLESDLKVSKGGPLNFDHARLSDKSTIRNMTTMNEDQLKAWRAAYEPKNDKLKEMNPKGRDMVRWKYQRYIKDYLRTIRGVDENIGRMLDYLDESGLAENTIVIYSSDQGFYLGDHGWYDKRWMYEESFLMPFIVKWPGLTDKSDTITESTTLIQNIDYAETFLDIAGIDIPEDMQGRSLVPVFEEMGKTPRDWRESLYYHYYEYPSVHMVPKHYGIRTDRYKLISFYEFDEWEFYDLHLDPEEITNLYPNEAYAEKIGEMKKKLAALREEMDDTSDITPKPVEWRNTVRKPGKARR